MKIALLLSGNPRFCKDFDLQLKQLEDYNIDWYTTMWNRYHSHDTRISPNWNGTTTQDLKNWIQLHLPTKHNLEYIELVPDTLAPKPTRTYKEFYANTTNLLQQFWILDYCDQQRRNSNKHYDLIIRSRPDITLNSKIDLIHTNTLLDQHPNWIIMPNNERRGNPPICDQFAITKPDTMTAYTQSYKLFDQLYNQGIPYNPEFLLSAACLQQGLSWPNTDFDIGLRVHGTHVPGYFHPDFGNWL